MITIRLAIRRLSIIVISLHGRASAERWFPDSVLGAAVQRCSK
jgi:hypothetical protein